MSSYSFVDRHIGPGSMDLSEMLKTIGVSSLDELIDRTVPAPIRLKKMSGLSEPLSEMEYFNQIREIGKKNKLYKSYIGMGYYNTVMPAVIQRNILENPAWYTSYTPYQAEISQGRLEALLNFQTVIADLTGMEIANASLLDEATAAAEAMIMMFNLRSRDAVKRNACRFYADEKLFPQTIEVIRTRAVPLGIEVVVTPYREFALTPEVFGCMVQYPDANGSVNDYRGLVEQAHKQECLVGVAADILSLVLLSPPGEWGADIAVGSAQRFGIPMGYGGPHAGFFACKDKFKRNMPGRIIGVSVDRRGNRALRMALQTREQHIKRERATSNICTAQALLATMAGMYAVYHGREGLERIAGRVHSYTAALEEGLVQLGYLQLNKLYFDTLLISLPAGISMNSLRSLAVSHEMNFRYISDNLLSLSLDETTLLSDLAAILEVFAIPVKKKFTRPENLTLIHKIPQEWKRNSSFLSYELFRNNRSETEMMRYIKRLERKDFSLVHGMIPLGSCTMKLNAAVEMLPLSWPEFGSLHPFVPIDQTEGYQQLFYELGHDLCAITGFSAVSFQPNSGAAGEYTGLLVIREYQKSRGESHRNVVLIPASAHGTNPASAVMAGLEVIVVNCDENGNVDMNDLLEKAGKFKDRLSAFMITYPSTHGVFETNIREMITAIHEAGGQVYMDGANMNAQVGLTNPAMIGADVCHLNLHKTFAIPHGGGGPGVGPIAVADHLVEFLPGHPVVVTGGKQNIGPVAAAPWGSASILVISYAYCKMLGAQGLTDATRYAILNANYLAARLNGYFKVLYKGHEGFVAHEMILDLRPFKPASDISELDVAKRLLDYGFHAPTVSFPVHGTLMVEPTESEPKAELDRFVEAMISIWKEIQAVAEGKADKTDNVLKNAPHPAEECLADEWKHGYPRSAAAYPLESLKADKFWPTVARVDDAFGDRNLVCTCAPTEAYR
ncbi:MAG: aminomethyl-transferring glycine dehydrogenase [Bacteroidales bacterium]